MRRVARILVGSLMLGSLTLANAAIDDDNAFAPGDGDGGGELFLSVIDRGAPKPMSYVLDLGITARQFIESEANHYPQFFIAAPDDKLKTLLANPGGTVAWNIAAVHNDLGPYLDDLGYLTTAPAAAPPIANVNTLIGFNGMAEGIHRAGLYLQLANAALGANDSALITDPKTNALYDGPYWGDTWHTSLHRTQAGLGETLRFYQVATDFTNDPTGNSSRVVPFSGRWLLSTDGLLTYTVPLPPAVWLFASALVGMAGVFRRASGGTTAERGTVGSRHGITCRRLM